jgi:preprotein translocase subunit SecF
VVQRVDYVGPQVGNQLRNKGIAALLYAMVAILVYVAFRFDFKFGPGALLAMVHDVIMVSGYYLVSRREFNLTSIAVRVTITGYSINDTIVIYDRIREEMHRYKGQAAPEIINIAVNDTLSRTILTSGVTALLAGGPPHLRGGEIWDFAMAMPIGIVVGTYSSVYIASPLTIWLDQRAAKRHAEGGEDLEPESGNPPELKPVGQRFPGSPRARHRNVTSDATGVTLGATLSDVSGNSPSPERTDVRRAHDGSGAA